MVKTNAQGEREIIVKKGTKITAYKVSGKTATGDGERLGTAYRLANGQIIYVPEGPDDAAASVAAAARRRCIGALALDAALLLDSGSGTRDSAARPAAEAPRSRIPDPDPDPHRLRLLRRQPARHPESVQVTVAGAARPPRPCRAHLPHRVGDVGREGRRDLARERAGARHDEPADARALQRHTHGRPDWPGARTPRQGVRRRRRAAAEGDLPQTGRDLGRARTGVLGAHGVLEPGRACSSTR